MKDGLQSLRSLCLRSFPEFLADIKLAATSRDINEGMDVSSKLSEFTISVCALILGPTITDLKLYRPLSTSIVFPKFKAEWNRLYTRLVMEIGRWAKAYKLGEGGRAMGNGQWAMGNGQWAMGNGQWAMGNGQWAMGNGPLLEHFLRLYILNSTYEDLNERHHFDRRYRHTHHRKLKYNFTKQTTALSSSVSSKQYLISKTESPAGTI